jgi:hypothetical protein
MLWGLWDVMIDPASGTIETVPIRGPEFTANVTVFLQPPKGSLNYLKFTNLDLTKWFDQGLIELDVGLTHPFPGYDEYTGFDVLTTCRTSTPMPTTARSGDASGPARRTTATTWWGSRWREARRF